ncbi:MAG: thioredoxin reductase, partial [Firmicutes bacterium]|nr:thioredoxin reductase [Bacillota bacterium]
TTVDFSQRPFKITVDESEVIEADTVIISTGASAKLLGIPGERENIGRGVSTCATCDGFFYNGKKVLVVGGGDSAMEEGNFLTKFADVTVVHRRSELRASKIMQDRVRENAKVSWALGVAPIEVIAGEKGFQGLKVKDSGTGEERVLEADGLFVAIGHRPNTEFLAGQIDLDEQGYIQTKPGSAETNIPGVFACGDVQDHKYRQAITAAGSGCMAALDCERFLEGAAAHDWSQTLNK